VQRCIKYCLYGKMISYPFYKCLKGYSTSFGNRLIFWHRESHWVQWVVTFPILWIGRCTGYPNYSIYTQKKSDFNDMFFLSWFSICFWWIFFFFLKPRKILHWPTLNNIFGLKNGYLSKENIKYDLYKKNKKKNFWLCECFFPHCPVLPKVWKV